MGFNKLCFDSEKYLNEQAKKAPVNASDELFNALAYSKELCSLTKGKFNRYILGWRSYSF